MTGNRITKRMWMFAAALALACTVLTGCVSPAYANVDPTWEEEVTVIPEEPAAEALPEETIPEASQPEQGFTTPGNADLGDEITNSTGKDFYTIRTKNNNTFYMVIDHANSTENVYMLSLIDENDLAEFMDQTEEESEREVIQPPVVIPETPAVTEAPQVQEETESRQVRQMPSENSSIWILAAGAVIFALLYYFKIYKPGHEEEEDDSEGIEMGDGFPTEHEE